VAAVDALVKPCESRRMSSDTPDHFTDGSRDIARPPIAEINALAAARAARDQTMIKLSQSAP